MAIVDSRRAYVSSDRGRTFRRAGSFETDYGFYAAGLRMDRRARIDMLVPSFSTCTSADRLEGVRAIRAGGGGRVPLPDFIEEGESMPLLGPDRVLLVARRADDSNRCSLYRYRRVRYEASLR